MKFKKIRFKNILSFGNAITEMDLNTNKTTLITGENGSGKTASLEAFYFALTGKPFRKINKADIINSTNKKDLYTELEFDHDGHEYILKRGIKPNIFELHRDNKLIPLDAKVGDYQDMLESLIGIDSETFSQTLFISSKNYKPFMKLAAAEKRNFIENVLNIKIFSDILEAIKVKRSLQGEKHNEITYMLKNAQDRLNVAKESNEKFAASKKEEKATLESSLSTETENLIPIDNELDRIEKWLSDNDIISKIGEIEESIKEADEKVFWAKEKIHDVELSIKDNKHTLERSSLELAMMDKQFSKEIADLEDSYTNKISQCKTTNEKAVSDIENDYKRSLKTIEQHNDFVIKVEHNQIEELKEKIKFYSDTSVCPTCNQAVDKESECIQAHIKELENKIQVHANKIERLKEEFTLESAKLKEEKERLIFNKMGELTIEIEKLKKKLIEDREAKKEDAAKKKKSREEEIPRLQAFISPLEQSLSDLNKKLPELIQRVSMLKNEKEPLSKNYEKSKDRKNSLNNQKSVIESMIRSYKTRIKEIESTKEVEFIKTDTIELELEEARKALDESDYQKETISEMIKILSDKGIKNHIVSKYIPIINEVMNKYLEIFSANYRISFDSNFDISIKGRGYENLGYHSFSSGEEQRVDLAILFSFYEIGKIKASMNTNIFVGDEISDRSLDSAGLDGLFSIFEQMKRAGMTVFNVTHRPEIKDRFDKTLFFRKINGFTSITEE